MNFRLIKCLTIEYCRQYYQLHKDRLIVSQLRLMLPYFGEYLGQVQRTTLYRRQGAPNDMRILAIFVFLLLKLMDLDNIYNGPQNRTQANKS